MVSILFWGGRGGFESVFVKTYISTNYFWFLEAARKLMLFKLFTKGVGTSE